MKRIAVLLLLSATLFSGCASTKLMRTEVATQHKFNVSLEQVQKDGATVPLHYAHPHKINPADLKELLSNLNYTEQAGLLNEEKTTPVFQSVEISRLTPAVTDALAKANPNQRVRFISYNLDKGVLFSKSRKTEGIVFVDSSGRLNLAFNYINQDRISSETSAINPQFAIIDPLTIDVSETPLATLPSYVELNRLKNGQQAPMWLTTDFKMLKQASSAEKAPAIISGAEEISAVPAGAKKAPTVTSAAKKSAVTLNDEKLRADIKNKLKYLKELLDEGLITESNYNVKKMQLLDKIQ